MHPTTGERLLLHHLQPLARLAARPPAGFLRQPLTRPPAHSPASTVRPECDDHAGTLGQRESRAKGRETEIFLCFVGSAKLRRRRNSEWGPAAFLRYIFRGFSPDSHWVCTNTRALIVCGIERQRYGNGMASPCGGAEAKQSWQCIRSSGSSLFGSFVPATLNHGFCEKESSLLSIFVGGRPTNADGRCLPVPKFHFPTHPHVSSSADRPNNIVLSHPMPNFLCHGSSMLKIKFSQFYVVPRVQRYRNRPTFPPEAHKNESEVP